jgi:hypothetical protein
MLARAQRFVGIRILALVQRGTRAVEVLKIVHDAPREIVADSREVAKRGDAEYEEEGSDERSAEVQ